MELQDILNQLTPTNLTVGGGFLAGAYFVVREFMRRFSRDKVEVAKDRAETNVIELLQQELDKALARVDKAENERNIAYAQITELNRHISDVEAQLLILQDELVRLRAEIKSLRNEPSDDPT